MRPVLSASKQMFSEIRSDAMLSAILFAPILMGLFFRFAIPFIEGILCSKLSSDAILTPFYPAFNLLLCMMTPMMFAFAGGMVILGEADNGIAKALCVTPLGKNGYLLSRIGIPTLLSVIYCFAAVSVFHLTDISILMLIALSMISGLLGAAVSLMVVSVAKNKVEGLAISKLSGIAVAGLPAVLFVPEPANYIAGILPTFWMTKLLISGNCLFIIPSFAVTVLWLLAFGRKFKQKVLS